MRQPTKKCYDCNHCEMCAWIKEVEEQGCEFFDNGNKWIPCSERLPKIEREGQRRGWYSTTNEYGSVGMTQYEFYHDLLKTGWQSEHQIVAWMPLPEKYKGE